MQFVNVVSSFMKLLVCSALGFVYVCTCLSACACVCVYIITRIKKRSESGSNHEISTHTSKQLNKTSCQNQIK